jgi:hypothetical protein
MKFKVTIERVLREEYEMILEDESITNALDEARKIVAVRNEKNKVGQFFITKIETKEK